MPVLIDLSDELLRYIIYPFDDMRLLVFISRCSKELNAIVREHPAVLWRRVQVSRIGAWGRMRVSIGRLGSAVWRVDWHSSDTRNVHQTASLQTLSNNDQLQWLFDKEDEVYKYTVKIPALVALREFVEKRDTYLPTAQNSYALCHRGHCECKGKGIKWNDLLISDSIRENWNRHSQKVEYILTSTKYCLQCLDAGISVQYRARKRPADQTPDDDLLLVRADGWVERPGSAPAPSSCLMQRRYIKTLRTVKGLETVDHFYGVVVVAPPPENGAPSNAPSDEQ